MFPELVTKMKVHDVKVKNKLAIIINMQILVNFTSDDIDKHHILSISISTQKITYVQIF